MVKFPEDLNVVLLINVCYFNCKLTARWVGKRPSARPSVEVTDTGGSVTWRPLSRQRLQDDDRVSNPDDGLRDQFRREGAPQPGRPDDFAVAAVWRQLDRQWSQTGRRHEYFDLQ